MAPLRRELQKAITELLNRAALMILLLSNQVALSEPLPSGGVPAGSIPVAFTLDDLGTTGSEPVGRIAKALRDAGVPEAYGFVVGSALQSDTDNQASLRVWLRYGYPVGNHTFSHEGFDSVSTEFFAADILANDRVLRRYARPGDNWHWFRYPHLSEGETREKRDAIRDFLGNMPDGSRYRIAQVTVDYPDWLFDTAYGRCLKQGRSDRTEWLKHMYLEKAIHSFGEAQRSARELFGRDIPHVFLVHYSRFTAEVMPELLADLKDNGARFITLEEAQSDPVFDMDPGIVLPSGENFLAMHALAKFPPSPASGPIHASSWKAKVKGACPERTKRVAP